MQTLTSPKHESKIYQDQQTRRLHRAVWMAFSGLILLSLAFAGYYYWDRYVHPGDRTPLEMSIARLEEQVRANPAAVEPRLALAEHYLSNQQYGRAIDQARQILHSYPDNQNAVFLLGIALVLDGQTTPGISVLEQYTTTARKSPTAHSDLTLQAGLYYLGTAYLQSGQAAAAVPVLEEALRINSIDADALFQLGLAYSELGEHHQAIERYHQATNFVPDFYEAYQGLERCYQALGEEDLVRYARGMQLFTLGEYNPAINELQAALGNQSEFAPVWLGLGLVQEQQGELTAAQESLRQALALDPDNFLINNSLARLENNLKP